MNCIYAGIITYNCNLNRLKENIGSVLPQVQGLVVVDNGSDNINGIRALLNEYEILGKPIYLIENKNNMGVAKALNQIMSEAASKGMARWVLTLDDDTVVYDNLIAMYEEYIITANENKSIHLASLTCLRKDRNYVEKNNNGTETTPNCCDMQAKSEFVHTCITSGNLVSVEAWKAVGGFDERLFIDMVDDEFCLRLEAHDYDIVRINSYGYLHEMGNDLIKVSFLGKQKTIFAYSPMRKYYTARNITYICRKYRNTLGKKNEYTKYLNKRILGTLLYEKNKIKGLKAYIKGIRDGKKMY